MAMWKAQRTLLIVGEGRTEEAFLNHVKGLYVTRGCGLSVTVKNARGKGAKHVVEWTVRQSANAQYDGIAVLLDTDTDWSQTVAKNAKKKKIKVLKSQPCFEALMLRVIGKSDVGSVDELKKRFAPHVNGDSTQRQQYAQNFSADVLESSRKREQTIGMLLELFGR